MGTDFVPTGMAVGVAGSILSGVRNWATGGTGTVTIGAGGNFVVPAGCWMATDAGTNIALFAFDGTVWSQASVAAGSIPFFCSDGINMRFQNAGAGNQTVDLQKIG